MASDNLLKRPLSGTRGLIHRLRAPDSGVLGQGVRFALVGGIVATVYLLITTVLAVFLGVPFQVALAIGTCLALAAHFTLQRAFVWAHEEEFALPFRHQVGRYLLVTGTQYGITAASTTLLPAALGLSTEVVYLATATLIASANFLIFRHGVFHASAAAAEPTSGSVLKIA
jgi:putative flippase GtrA